MPTKPKECASNPLQYYNLSPKWGCNVLQSSDMIRQVSRIKGKGGWRNVYGGEYKNMKVVLKRLNFWHRMFSFEGNSLKEKYRNIRLEASILENLKECQNVPHLLGYCGLDIVTEELEDTLIHAVEHNANMRDSMSRALVMSLGAAQGVRCLSNMEYGPVAHGDLHPGQFLVDKEGKAYINDFDKAHALGRSYRTGAPCSVVHYPNTEQVHPHLSIGPLEGYNVSLDNFSLSDHELGYFSYDDPGRGHPDLVHFGLISEKTDIYSLGEVIHYIISNGQSHRKVKSRTHLNKYATIYGDDMPNLLMDMWQIWPELRPSADEVVSRLSALLENIGPDGMLPER